MKTKLPFGEILEAADALPVEDQEALIDVLHRRIVECRREEILKDVHEAEQEFEKGQCRPVTAAELMKEILP